MKRRNISWRCVANVTFKDSRSRTCLGNENVPQEFYCSLATSYYHVLNLNWLRFNASKGGGLILHDAKISDTHNNLRHCLLNVEINIIQGKNRYIKDHHQETLSDYCTNEQQPRGNCFIDQSITNN